MASDEQLNVTFSVGVVAGADKETFCTVLTEGGLIKKMFFNCEQGVRTLLKDALKDPANTDSILSKARQNPI